MISVQYEHKWCFNMFVAWIGILKDTWARSWVKMSDCIHRTSTWSSLLELCFAGWWAYSGGLVSWCTVAWVVWSFTIICLRVGLPQIMPSFSSGACLRLRLSITVQVEFISVQKTSGAPLSDMGLIRQYGIYITVASNMAFVALSTPLVRVHPLIVLQVYFMCYFLTPHTSAVTRYLSNTCTCRW